MFQDFENLVKEHYSRYLGILNLSEPKFNKNGYIVVATMFSGDFRVEIRCAPSEYNAEIFIYTKNNRKWSLSDLIAIDQVLVWLKTNSSDIFSKSRLESEIICIFGLLAYALPVMDEFKWLLVSASQ